MSTTQSSDSQPIVNRVANSSLLSFDLGEFYPDPALIHLFDIAPWLFHGIILKEKDFRDHVAAFDFSSLSGKAVAITCSVDAIIPQWAWMILATKLAPYAAFVHFGSIEETHTQWWLAQVQNHIQSHSFQGARLVIKGCSQHPTPSILFVNTSLWLAKSAASIMFGEPCSTVPVWKAKSPKP